MIMKIYIDDYKNLVIITPSKVLRANIPIKINKCLKYDIRFIVNPNKSLANYKIKKEIC